MTIQNNSAIVQNDLHFVDALKNGFVYVPDRTSPVQYDAASLKGGQALTFQYKVKITTRLQKSSLGEVRLHNFKLKPSLAIRKAVAFTSTKATWLIHND